MFDNNKTRLTGFLEERWFKWCISYLCKSKAFKHKTFLFSTYAKHVFWDCFYKLSLLAYLFSSLAEYQTWQISSRFTTCKSFQNCTFPIFNVHGATYVIIPQQIFVAVVTCFHLYGQRWVEKFKGFLLMHGALLNYVS